MKKVWPALAFYLQHPDEVDALLELSDDEAPPDGTDPEQWALFLEVVERSNAAGAALILGCLKEGREALGDRITGHLKGGKFKEPSLESIQTYWEACYYFRLKGTKTVESFFGVGIWTKEGGKNAWLVPYVGKDKMEVATRDEVREKLYSVTVEPPEWLYTNALPLALLDLTPESDLDDLQERCADAFKRFAPFVDVLTSE